MRKKAQASCLRLAEKALKVGRDQDLAAYVWFMQEYRNKKIALDLALDILGERYGYPEDPPEEGFPIDHSSTVCKPDPVKTVSEIIDDVKTQICGQYCKYADGVTGEGYDQRLEKYCSSCPLNKL